MFLIGTWNEKAETVRKRPRLTSSESGQGTLEYILVLVVVIIIILSFLYQFNSSFKKYASALFDGYFACILETGELPGNSQTCAAEFAAYDDSGKNLLKDNLPTGGGGSEKDKAEAAKKEAASDAARKNGGGGGGGESVGGGGSRPTVGRFGDSGRRGSSDVGKLEADKAEGGLGSDSFIGMSNTVSVGRTSETYRPNSVSMAYSMDGDTGEKEETRPGAVAAGKSADRGDGLRGTKGFENLNRGPAELKSKDDRSFSISEFIRFMLILLIVVAMVIFFGGQLLAISKGRDKGGD